MCDLSRKAPPGVNISTLHNFGSIGRRYDSSGCYGSVALIHGSFMCGRLCIRDSFWVFFA